MSKKTDKKKQSLRFHESPFHVTHSKEKADKMAAELDSRTYSEAIITLSDSDFDKFIEECKNAKPPNEALRKAANALYSDLDPNDPDYFEKRILEKERKRQIQYALPTEWAEERLEMAKAAKQKKDRKLKFSIVKGVIRHAEIQEQMSNLGLAEEWLRFMSGKTMSVIDDSEEIRQARNEGVYITDIRVFCATHRIELEIK